MELKYQIEVDDDESEEFPVYEFKYLFYSSSDELYLYSELALGVL